MPDTTVTVLHAAGVLDVDTGNVIESGFVRVEGNRITAVGSESSLADNADELIELPLLQLLDPRLRGERHASRDGHEIVIPYFEIAGKHVWGATAMVLAELCAVLAELR